MVYRFHVNSCSRPCKCEGWARPCHYTFFCLQAASSTKVPALYWRWTLMPPMHPCKGLLSSQSKRSPMFLSSLLMALEFISAPWGCHGYWLLQNPLAPLDPLDQCCSCHHCHQWSWRFGTLQMHVLYLAKGNWLSGCFWNSATCTLLRAGRGRFEDKQQRRRQCDLEGRDWSDAATHRKRPSSGSHTSGRTPSPQKPLVGTWLCLHFHFGSVTLILNFWLPEL